MITICKKPGIKNCVRITTEEDIPGFLKDAVRVDGDTLVLDCLEGEEKVPAGSVIAFEQLENGKMNVWNKANWATTTIEKDGKFYDLPKPVKAILLNGDMPKQLIEELGDTLTFENGEYHLKTDWGISSAASKNGYLVVYGRKPDGTLDANILTVGTPSFANYYVLNNEGKIDEPLQEYHNKLFSNKR